MTIRAQLKDGRDDESRGARSTRMRLAVWSPLPLRLIAGLGFIIHGYAKLARGPDVFVATLTGLHVPAPFVMAWLTILFEIVGGLAVLAGFLIPLVSVPLVMILAVAIATVHLPFGFTAVKLIGVTANGPQFGPPGYETNLLYIAMLIALSVGGSGPLALDDWLRRRR